MSPDATAPVSPSTAPVKDDPLRARLRVIVEARWFQRLIIGLIMLNAVTLGLETSKSLMASHAALMGVIDTSILAVFVAELVMRIYVHRGAFFRDPWGWFDLVVVGIALMPSTGSLSVLRALRILRVLRLISVVPSMKRVVSGLLSAVPGMGSVVALMGLVFYVGAVIATKLFQQTFPQWFGTVGESLYTLFQIMTLESWSMGIVRPVMDEHPMAWLFFVPFILIATFMMLNLFIAVIVSAMDQDRQSSQDDRFDQVMAELKALRTEVEALRQPDRPS